MKTIIVGMGEVGHALRTVLEVYNPFSVDINTTDWILSFGPIEIMHIAFPFTNNFIENVKEYQNKYKPKYTIIHSTVPVGTSSQVGAVHSPIRGIHPFLEQGIKTFVKFLGGTDASAVADYFKRAGLRVCLYDNSETTEALKLWDTQYFLECIRFAQRVKAYCDKHNLNFHEVYTLANQTYNEGYEKLGYEEYVRPVLQPIMKEIGGHCLLPNEKLLDEK